MRIRPAERNDANLISLVTSIHLSAFPGFFLTFMGRDFLETMYMSYVEHEPSGILLAEDDRGLLGFLSYSGDFSGLYKFMLRKHFFAFGWYSFCAFLRKPGCFIRLLRAFLKPGEAKREENYLELSSIGVDPRYQNEGVGTGLISALIELADFSVFSYITLETDGKDNDKANAFYRKNGFALERKYTTSEGRDMNEYRYYG